MGAIPELFVQGASQVLELFLKDLFSPCENSGHSLSSGPMNAILSHTLFVIRLLVPIHSNDYNLFGDVEKAPKA